MQKKRNNKYTSKFKDKAIRLVLEQGHSVHRAAKELGMPRSTLGGWVRGERAEQSEKEIADFVEQQKPEQEGELQRLQQELRRVKQERNELKRKCNVVISPLSQEKTAIIPEHSEHDIFHDDGAKNLLADARMQWQFGDWQSLVDIDDNQLCSHPDRARLALLVATGWQQLNDQQNAGKYISLAKKWGCSKQLIARLLIAGVHNTLGRAAAAGRQENRAIQHFKAAVKGVSGDERLACQARSVREITKLGLLQQAASQINQELNGLLPQGDPDKMAAGNPHLKVLQTEVEILQHELSLAQQRQQLFPPSSEQPKIITDAANKEWRAALQRKSVSQLGQDIWILQQTNYKRQGFFVEFGATDGVLLSNTYLLEKEFGWQGICAEPNPEFFKKLQHNRGCKLSNACIGEKTGEIVSFVYAAEYGGMQKHAKDDMHADKRQAYAALPDKTAELETISLHDFLLSLNAPEYIDYLSIDTEGSEFDILQGFPFEKWHIHLITVEHNFTERRAAIRNLLEKNGYQCTEMQWDDWYELQG